MTAAFLWPFATEAHIKNQPLPFLRDGPYPAQLGDAYLNRKIAANIDPETAVAEYLEQDLARIAHLDRRYELVMEKQRQRDNIAGYNFADLIDRYFRSEPVFLSPAHPELRIAIELATQFFNAMCAGSDAILRLKRELLVTPFPKDEAPIHPSVCRHFGLKFITDADAQKYRFRYEGSFTFREFALRYMRYEWNPDLDEGVALSMSGKVLEAVEKLSTALTRSTRSGDGHLHMAESLARIGRLEDAAAAAHRAAELDPSCRHASWNLLSHLFFRQGKDQEAIAAARRAVALAPSDVHYNMHLGELLKRTGDLAGAEEAFGLASRLSPPNPHAIAQFGELRVARGGLEDGIAALRQAVALDPANSHFSTQLGTLLKQAGELAGAEEAFERASRLDVAGPSVIVIGNTRVHLPNNLAGGYVEEVHRLRRMGRSQDADIVLREAAKHFPDVLALPHTDAIRANSQRELQESGEIPGGPKQTLGSALDFLLSPHAGPALQFINPEGKVGAAIQVRYERSSGQGSFQYWIYDQKDGRRYEPFRVNGDEHPPEEPNSRFNRHARFLHGFYTPGVVEPEKGSMEFHCDPGQPVLQITSHKTDQPLMVLHQFDAPEDGFPIIVLHNPSGVAFTVRRNGDMTLKGTLWAGGAVVIDAAVTEPKHAATKAYVDNAMGALRDEIGRLREELTKLRSAQHDSGGKAPGLPRAPDTVE